MENVIFFLQSIYYFLDSLWENHGVKGKLLCAAIVIFGGIALGSAVGSVVGVLANTLALLKHIF